MKKLDDSDILNAAKQHIEDWHPDVLGNTPLQLLMESKISLAYFEAVKWAQEQLQSEKHQQQHKYTFTKRELEVLKLAYLPNKIIADQLHVSGHAIHSHMQNMRRKMGFRNKGDMVVYATKAGIIKENF